MRGRRAAKTESYDDGERRGRMRGRRDARAERYERAERKRRGGRERGGRRSHLAIRPIEKFVSKTVGMKRLLVIPVSQPSAGIKTDNGEI